jgi:hypothetical protein
MSFFMHCDAVSATAIKLRGNEPGGGEGGLSASASTMSAIFVRAVPKA